MFPACEENSYDFRSARKSKLLRARALTTIYGGRLAKIKRKKPLPRTALEECRRPDFMMLKNDTIPKPSMSPFNPLPAIGKMASQRTSKNDKPKTTNVILFDITKSDPMRPATIGAVGTEKIKLHDILQPLSPPRTYRKGSTESLDETRPQLLLRENTYDVIKPIFLSATKVKKRDSSMPRRTLTPMVQNSENTTEINNNMSQSTKSSAKSRFKKAAMDVGKLTAVPETGKLLYLRERETIVMQAEEDEKEYSRPYPIVSPTQKLNKLSEIFQNLEVKGRHRDKMKKENNWF